MTDYPTVGIGIDQGAVDPALAKYRDLKKTFDDVAVSADAASKRVATANATIADSAGKSAAARATAADKAAKSEIDSATVSAATQQRLANQTLQFNLRMTALRNKAAADAATAEVRAAQQAAAEIAAIENALGASARQVMTQRGAYWKQRAADEAATARELAAQKVAAEADYAAKVQAIQRGALELQESLWAKEMISYQAKLDAQAAAAAAAAATRAQAAARATAAVAASPSANLSGMAESIAAQEAAYAAEARAASTAATATGEATAATAAASAAATAYTSDAAMMAAIMQKNVATLQAQGFTLAQVEKAYGATSKVTLAFAAAQAEATTVTEAATVATTAHTAATVAGGAAITGSSLKIREFLVILREASRGDLTRLAGSLSILAGAFGLMTAEILGAAAGLALLLAPFIAVAGVMYLGQKQASDFNAALLKTGNYAGMTADAFEAMSKQIADSTGTGITGAKKAVESLVSSGKFNSETIKLLADTAVRYSELTGQSTDKIIADFEEMKGGVVKWAVKHEEVYHDLTLAQIDYINGIEKQGDHEKAAEALATDLHNAAVARTAKLEQSYGYLQVAMKDVATWASDMWDKILGIGRPQTPDQQIADVTARLHALQTTPVIGGTLPGQAGANQRNIRLQAIHEAQAQLKTLNDQKATEEAKAAAAAKAAQDQDNAIRAKYDNQAKHEHQEKQDRAAEEIAQLKQTIASNVDEAAAYDLSTAAGFRASAMAKANADIIKIDKDAHAVHTTQLERETLRTLELQAAVTKQTATTEKDAAALNDRADIMEQVNAVMAATGEAQDVANKQVTDAIALKKQQAAVDNADAAHKAAAIKALSDLEAAQKRVNDGALQAYLIQQQSAQSRENDLLNVKLDLIGATNREIDAQIAKQTALNGIYEKDPSAKNRPLTAQEQSVVNGAVGNSEKGSNLQSDQDSYNKSLTYTLDILNQIKEASVDTGNALASAFGAFGKSIGDINTAMATYAARQEEINVAQAAAEKPLQATINATKDNADATGTWMKAVSDLATLQQKSDAERTQANDQYIQASISGVKEMFSKNSAAYKALSVIEMAYRALQLVGTIQAIAGHQAETASSIAGSIARAAAHGVEAVAHAIASQPFPFNLVAGAITAAAIAALGIGVMSAFGGGGAQVAPPTSADQQAAQGAGSIAGDVTAQSKSIQDSLDAAKKYQDQDLDYANQQVVYLQKINDSIGALTSAVAQQITAGGALDPRAAALGIGTSGTGGFLGIGKSTTTNSLYDQGVNLGSGSLSDYISGRVAASYYQTVQSTKTNSGFFGIGGGTSTSYSTTTSSAADLQAYIADVLKALSDGVEQAATQLGVSGAKAIIDALPLSIGNISLQGLSASDLQAQLQAVFSKVGDEMAAAVIPGFASMQKAGEGMLETLERLATEYTTVDAALASIGQTFSLTGVDSIAARDGLVQLLGGLDGFTSEIGYYQQNFLTTAQQIAPIQAAVSKTMSDLGYSAVTTKAQFVDLVSGIDLTTTAGQKLFASLMQVAPSFGKVADYQDTVASKKADLDIQLLQATGHAQEAVNAQRAIALAQLPESLQAEQKMVWALQDQQTATEAATQAAQNMADAWATAWQDAETAVSTAQSNLSQAYQSAVSQLQSTISTFQGFAGNLTAFINTLNTTDLGDVSTQGQYDAAKATFNADVAAARGDPTAKTTQDALQNISTAGQAELELSKQTAKTQYDYAKDVAAVRLAATQARDFAQDQVDTATKQLDALNQMVAGFSFLNKTTQSVADAITALAVAEAKANNLGMIKDPQWGALQNEAVNKQLAQATNYTGTFGAGGFDAWIRSQGPGVQNIAAQILTNAGQSNRIDWPQYMDPQWGAYQNIAVNQLLAQRTGYGGAFGGGGWQAWIVNQSDDIKKTARDILTAAGQTSRIQFAAGGAFTNGIVQSPVLFNPAEMGEVGPEGILPLSRTSRGLGVHAIMPGQSGIVGKLDDVLSAIQTSGTAQAVYLNKIAEKTDKWDKQGLYVHPQDPNGAFIVEPAA